MQLCIVHQVRNSLKYVSWKDHKAVAADLKEIYTAAAADVAALRLEQFAHKRGERYAAIAPGRERNRGG